MTMLATVPSSSKTNAGFDNERWAAARESAEAPLALNLGCGKTRLPGFMNIDREQGENVDFCTELPYGMSVIDDDSVELIYSENLVEMFSLEAAGSLIKECFRTLKSGGRIRVATVDLDALIHRYTFDWRAQEWLGEEPWSTSVRSRGAMINMAIRGCGHLYIYNAEDLAALLEEAGFQDIIRRQVGSSPERRFWDLERRPDSLLIFEGVK